MIEPLAILMIIAFATAFKYALALGLIGAVMLVIALAGEVE